MAIRKFAILWIWILGHYCVYGIDVNSTHGIINNWPIAPLQIGVGFNNFPYIFDGSSNAVLIFTPIGIEQQSGVCSLSCLNGLKYNYGLQIAGIACESECNYGISLGTIVNTSKNNYGFSFGMANIASCNHGCQIGFFSHFNRHFYQVFGISIASRFRIAVLNVDTQLIENDAAIDVGVFNIGLRTPIQIGILNYNEHAVIPWFPLFNFCINQKRIGD